MFSHNVNIKRKKSGILQFLVEHIQLRPFIFNKLVHRFFQATSEVGGGKKQQQK